MLSAKIINAQKNLTTAWFEGRDFECDDATNQASREVVYQYIEEYGDHAQIGKINLYGEERSSHELILRIAKDRTIYNFDAAFVIPKYDTELHQMISERDHGDHISDLKAVNAIMDKIIELEGTVLIWS